MNDNRTVPDDAFEDLREAEPSPCPDISLYPDAIPTNKSLLERAIERHVLAQLGTGGNGQVPSASRISEAINVDIDALLTALLDPDVRLLDDMVDALLSDAPSFQSAYRQILTPLARRLGDMWTEDSLSFVDVTVASARLNLLVDRLIARLVKDGNDPFRNRRVLLARVSGEDHSLGLAIVAACFREAGWNVKGGPDLLADERLFAELRSGDYPVLGLSAGTSGAVSKSRDVIDHARSAIGNGRTKILVGGAVISENPAGYCNLGADFVVTDALEAVEKAEEILN